LGQDPKRRILAVSYAEALSEKLALDYLKLIEAPWYRDAFPLVRIAKGKAARTDFETTRGGGRFSASIGGALTGRGGDIIIMDDPHTTDFATIGGRASARRIQHKGRKPDVRCFRQQTMLCGTNLPLILR